MNKLFIIIFSVALFVGCSKDSDYAYYSNQPRVEAKDNSYLARDIFSDAKIDILFVIDNSGSMGNIQNNIIKNAALFMENFLKNNDMKWKMGIVSTDKDDEPYLGFFNKFDNEYASTYTADQVVKEFKDAVKDLGVFGDASEYVFYNAYRFMSRPPYNTFFRPDAHLAIIMVTDEEEQSEDEYGARFGPINFINTIKSFKNPGRIVRFYGAFNFEDLEMCRSSIEPPYMGSPFERVITDTQGLYMSACVADFGKGLAEIGRDILSIVDSPKMLLEERPVIDSIRVYYDNTLIPSGPEEQGGYWFYSDKYSALHFYNLDFMNDKTQGSIRITYDIDDGVDRELDPRRK